MTSIKAPPRAAGRMCSPRALAAVGGFLVFGACMAALAGTMLLLPGTLLDRAWILNPTAYAELALYGRTVGPLFLLLSIVLVLAAFGWFRRRIWGWRLTVAIIATQMLGDLLNCMRGDYVRGGTGLVIASALMLYLRSARVRASFAARSESTG